MKALEQSKRDDSRVQIDPRKPRRSHREAERVYEIR
jgi:hypothetical protein